MISRAGFWIMHQHPGDIDLGTGLSRQNHYLCVDAEGQVTDTVSLIDRTLFRVRRLGDSTCPCVRVHHVACGMWLGKSHF